MQKITFEHFTDFIRQHTGISSKRLITPTTQFEKDLRITGDDGVDLLNAVEKHFGLTFPTDENESRALFNLKANEYLFESEGFGLINFTRLVRPCTVRNFTVGELYEAVCKRLL